MYSASPPPTPTTPKTCLLEGSDTISSSLSTSTESSPCPNSRDTSTQTFTPNSDNTSSDRASSTPTNPSPHPHPHPRLLPRPPTIHSHLTHHPKRRRRRHTPYPLLPRPRPRQPRPTFTNTHSYLLRPLYPLVSLETGLPHPLFPLTMLSYHLLSHTQLDTLAAHYHQLRPGEYSLGYPSTVVGRWGAGDGDCNGVNDGGKEGEEEGMVMKRRWGIGGGRRDLSFEEEEEEVVMREVRDVLRGINEVGDGGVEFNEECMRERKRRRFGRFIGMRGCESPGREDESVMRVAMEAWVGAEMERLMAEDEGRDGWRGKGAW